MKGTWRRLLIPGLVLLWASALWAGEIYQTLQFSPAEIAVSQADGYQRVTVPRAVVSGPVGSPEVPCLPVMVVIPPSATVEKVEVADLDQEVLPGSFMLHPVQTPSTFSRPAPPFVGPDPAYYNSTKALPGHYLEEAGTGTKSGFRIGAVRLYPVQYVPAGKQVLYARRIVLKITYQEGTFAPQASSPGQIQTLGTTSAGWSRIPGTWPGSRPRSAPLASWARPSFQPGTSLRWSFPRARRAAQ